MKEARVKAGRLLANLEQLAQIGRTTDGAVSRLAFSDADIDGRGFVTGLMQSAGLHVRVDAVGNIFGHRSGTDPSLPPILLGSHVDTVPNGGAYDGALGVLAAMEAVQSLVDSKHDTRHPVEVVAWSDEEGGLSGSRGFIGELTVPELDVIVAAECTLGEGITRIGGNPDRIADAVKSEGEVAAYLELHVEQGGKLEAEKVDIGVVTGIVGIRHHRATFTGVPNHAGTTPMDQRKNALLAGCECVLAVDRVIRSVEGSQVGTVGDLTVRPGAPNVIPGEVQLTVELRDLAMDKLDKLWEMLEPELNECAIRYGIEFGSEVVHSIDSVATSPEVQRIIAAAARELDLSFYSMPSGAGHDAQNLAQIAPTGMIFVPSVGGISHSRDEHTKAKDVEQGAAVLLNTLLLLDRAGSGES